MIVVAISATGIDQPTASVVGRMSASVASPAVAALRAGRTPGRTWRRDAGFLALVAALLRVPALLASAHLTFDDGVYGATVLALRAGGRPYRDVFSSQGPLHQPLLFAFDLLGFRTLDAPRLASLTAGIVATVVVYAIGRRVTTRFGALVAALLVAASGSMLFVTGPISGDGPALALAATAVLLALRHRDRPSTGRAIVVGAVMGAALCVKLLVLPAAVPVGLLLLRRDRRRDLGIAVGAAVIVFLAAALPWGIGNVWDQSVAYHQQAKRLHGYGSNFVRLLRTLAERDPMVLAALLLSAGTVAWRARWSRRPPAAVHRTRQVPLRLAVALLGTWAGAQVLLLVLEPAMWRPHVSQLIVPLSLLAALRPAPWPALAIAAVAVAPVYAANVHTMLWPEGYDRRETAVVERLERLPASAQVITDEPGFAWRAERRPPDMFVDTSIKRIQAHDLTAASIARAAHGAHVCAVLVWSGVRFGSFATLPDRLEAEGYHVAARYGGPRVLYSRGRCAG